MVQKVYEDSKTVVKCVVDVADGFKVGGGITSGIGSEPLFVCSYDGQVDRCHQIRVSMDSGVHR